MTDQVLVDPFAGGGGFWLASVGARLEPPVSWMGGKRRLARDLLALLDLRPGCRLPLILGDSSWWGWVWPTVLDTETGPMVSTLLRACRGEDPRKLWFRLRDLGPVLTDPPAALAAWRAFPQENAHLSSWLAGAAAQLLWLQARAASGVPVWWEGDAAVKWDRTRVGNVGPANQTHAAEPSPTVDGAGQETRGANGKGVHGGPGRLVQWASTAVDGAGQRQATEPRLLAQSGPRADGSRGVCEASMSGDKAMLLASDGRGVPRECGHKGRDSRGGGGIVDPGTIAGRLDAIRASARLVKGSGGEAGFGYDDGVRRGKGWRLFEPGDVADRLDRLRAGVEGIPVIVEHIGARDLAERWAPELRSRALVYLDPPYDGRTGYPSTCSRAEVLALAEFWARHGARVVLSEADGLAAALGPGWSQVCLQHPTRKKKAEWATVYGCDVRAVLPPLLRLAQHP